MTRIIGERYGHVEDFFFLNYDFEKILRRVGMGSMELNTGLVKRDLASEMDDMLEKALEDKDIEIDSESFESLFTINKKDLQRKDNENEVAFTE